MSFIKIGIATLHYSDNYGAVLQSWALKTVIERLPNCEAEIINYVPNGFSYRPCDDSDKTYKELCWKRYKFECFFKKYIGLNQPISRKIEGKGYDCICVGSDQVWNLTFEHTKNYEYLLPNVDDSIKKISYAASIGLGVKEADEFRALYKMYLPSFTAISVREPEHVKFVEDIVGKECSREIDPTLLLNSDEYNFLTSNMGEQLKNRKYLLLFWLHNQDVYSALEMANRIAIKYNLEIIHSFPELKGYSFYRDGGYMNYSGIEEFLDLIRCATCVLTNSYHATLFSIQFRTPFYIWPVRSMRSRIDALAYDYNIFDRIVDGYFETRDFSLDIKFDEIKEKIQKKRIASLKYLRTSIGV